MAVSPALLLIGLQMGTRLFTFVLNQALVRLSDPSVYGAAHIHLELLLGIVLFLSREGIRAASLRQQSPSSTAAKASRSTGSDDNLALIPIPVGVALAAIALPLFTRSSPELTDRPYFAEVMRLYLVSALLELLSEPIYLHALSPQGGRNIALRVKAEGMAAIAKGAVTLAAIATLQRDQALLAFGLGQFAYGAVILITFVGSYVARLGLSATKDLYIPRRSAAIRQKAGASSSQASTSQLALSLSIQSIFKHLLTEADKLAVSRLASLEDQGGYALGTNYASLPLRVLYQPLEESSRFQFSSQLGGENDDNNNNKQQSGTKSAKDDERAVSSSLSLLRALLHLHTYLGLLLLAFLRPLAKPFILIVSGAQWVSTSAPRTLAAYAYFLPALGWAGILEGFLQSTASESELKHYNSIILASSITFGLTLWAQTQMTLVTTEGGLIMASTLAMAVRAAWGWRYASNFFLARKSSQTISLRDVKPSNATLSALVAAAAMNVWVASTGASVDGSISSEHPRSLNAYVPILLTSFSTGLAVLGAIFLFDRASLIQALIVIKGSRNSS
ncbi:unnamed protein product [Jaminaea pallidilutea]